MSRTNRKSKCGNYTFCYGVDHVTGAFFQLYDHTVKDEDLEMVLQGDNMGIEIIHDANFTEPQAIVVNDLKELCDNYRKLNGRNPNLSASELFTMAKLFHIKVDEVEIRQLID